jgi:hypothetical protein
VNGEEERAGGAMVEMELGLTCGAREGYVASKFYAFDTHGGGTSGPSASGERTVREC